MKCKQCSVSLSVVSDSLQPHGLQPARLLCPEFSRQDTRVGCHFLLQDIFPTQGWNLCLLHQQADSLPLSRQGSPKCKYQVVKNPMIQNIRTSKQCPKYQGFSIPVLSHTELLDSEGTCEPVLQMHSLRPQFFPVRKRQLHTQNKFKCIIQLFNSHQVNFVKIFQTPF